MGQYSASLGHKANHAGWRANCELTPYEHPVFGSICCVRVLPHVTDAHGAAGIAAGTELTVSYAHLVDLDETCRPAWLCERLSMRNEDGYYDQLQFTPPRQVHSARSCVDAHGRVRVIAGAGG